MCIFCKIINGEIPSFKIYEDEYFLAFLDISQSTRGHTLIIPKKHFDSFYTLEDDYLKRIMKVAQEISFLLKEKLGASSVNLINNSGALAGQTVNHFHLHVIPRYPNDGVKINPKENEPNFVELKETHELIMKK